MDLETAKHRAARVMPEVLDELRTLVGIASVSSPAFPSEPVLEAGEEVRRYLESCGATNARLLEIPGGYPAVYAEIDAPHPAAPTVLLYAHYDVQPAPMSQGWDTDPFVATDGPDGRIYGRGAADDKSGVVIHGGVLRCFDGKPPVNIKILIEGEEESDSHLEDFVRDNQALVDADLFIVADSGGPRVGEPSMTTALRGEASCTVTLRTLDRALHSGLFGGAAPDALVALIQLLAKLHNEDGSVAVPGLHASEWDGAEVLEADVRENGGLLEGTTLVGSGSIASRLWSKPSVTVIGMDTPTVSEASNILIPEATARLSLRVPPGADASEQLKILTSFLEANVPWGANVEVKPLRFGQPFAVDTKHEFIATANTVLSEVYGTEAKATGSGGSIPLVAALQDASPSAGVILWGAEDEAKARIHASNESVDPAEIERMIAAEALLLSRIAD